MILHALEVRRVDRAFSAGRKPGGRAAMAMRAHLASCQSCRARYRRNLVWESALPDGAARAESRLWLEIQRVSAAAPAAVTLGGQARPGLAGQRQAGRPGLTLLLGAAAVAALLVVPASMFLRRDVAGRPVSRGGAPALGMPPTLHVFHAVGGTAAEPVEDRIRASDGLLFAYSNPGTAYSHLMVFAVDEAHRVYWFYPAYLRAGEDPEAIAIQPERNGVELAEEIRHPFSPGRARLFALFLPGPERVLTVEQAVARAYAAPGVSLTEEVPLGLPGAHQESRLLLVDP
jgi:hypothetical protein